MAKTKHVHIVGAGLSGLVAAINLAKDGYRVTMLDSAPAIGGDRIHHPSNHTTPINIDLIKNYVGIDVTPLFRPAQNTYFFLKNKKYHVAAQDNYSVERGPRETSLDSFLYKEALKLGVEFVFSQEVLNPFDLPDPTIIATGLFRKMYEILGRPMLRLPCFAARQPNQFPEREGEAACWFGDYTSTYAYKAVVNKLAYYLLFSNQDISLMDLKIYEEHLEKTEGMRFDHWDYFEVFVPLATGNAPCLFLGSKILAGTISGMMDPSFNFGIHGALLSGKTAALAVSDPERAARDFARFSRHYYMVWQLSHRQKNPGRLYLIKFLLAFPPAFRAYYRLAGLGVPGIERSALNAEVEYLGKK